MIRLLILYGIIAHILDGYFTARGCFVLGIHAEGNPIALCLMQRFGIIHGILILKSMPLPAVVWAWNDTNIVRSGILAVALALGGTIGYCSWLI